MVQDDNTDYTGIPPLIFWLLATWVVLVLLALVWGVDNAETTLREDARSNLAQDGHNIVVDFSGRDARLVGSVDSEELAAEIVESIDAVPGVRNVDSELEVIEPPPPVVRNPEVSVRIIGSAVSVRGAVPDTDIETDLIEAAEAQFGGGRVVNALVVSEDVELPPWLGRIRDVFPHIGELRSGGFTATDAGFEISGEVVSETVRTEMLQEITLILDETILVSSDLTIAVLPTPSFAATRSDGLVTLDGVMPNQETVDQIVEAARRLHGGTTIINGLAVGEVAGPMWLESIDGLLDVVTRLDPWTLEIAEGNVTITGLALDEDLAAAVAVLAQEVTAGQLAVVTDVQLHPAAVAIQLTNLLQGSTTFVSNGIELSTDGIGLLAEALAILEAHPTVRVTVAGYTDDQGDAETNLVLSQERAEAVVAYLVAGGIEPERLAAVGYGEENPIADNSTDEGRAQNRRIEFVILEGDG